MAITFAGRFWDAPHKARSSMLLGVPHTLFHSTESPDTFFIDNRNFQAGPQFPVNFKLTAIAYAHWKVKEWKISGSATESFHGQSFTDTWDNVVFSDYPRPEKEVELVNSVESGGAAADSTNHSSDAVFNLGFNAEFELEAGGEIYTANLWVQKDGNETKFYPSFYFYVFVGIASFLDTFQYPNFTQAGTLDFLGETIPLYADNTSSTTVTGNFTIEPHTLYDY